MSDLTEAHPQVTMELKTNFFIELPTSQNTTIAYNELMSTISVAVGISGLPEPKETTAWYRRFRPFRTTLTTEESLALKYGCSIMDVVESMADETYWGSLLNTQDHSFYKIKQYISTITNFLVIGRRREQPDDLECSHLIVTTLSGIAMLRNSKNSTHYLIFTSSALSWSKTLETNPWIIKGVGSQWINWSESQDHWVTDKFPKLTPDLYARLMDPTRVQAAWIALGSDMAQDPETAYIQRNSLRPAICCLWIGGYIKGVAPMAAGARANSTEAATWVQDSVKISDAIMLQWSSKMQPLTIGPDGNFDTASRVFLDRCQQHMDLKKDKLSEALSIFFTMNIFKTNRTTVISKHFLETKSCAHVSSSLGGYGI